MTWTHSDYVLLTTGSAAWVTKLKQHIKEVSDRIDTIVSSDGQSEDPSRMQDYADSLKAELARHDGSRSRVQKIMMGNTRGR